MATTQATNTQGPNIAPRRQPAKRKRETVQSRDGSNKSSRIGTPDAYARRSPRRDVQGEAPNDENRERSPPRVLKRPGAGARATANREVAEAARRRTEEEARAAVAARASTSELVASHYNAVPERGREWRRTDSQIKGLRSLNNWIKSTLIQKFSRPENMPQHGMTVLDMACGKGGDLGKWEKAPLVPALYVGCDIAGVSIDQAKQRYSESVKKNQGRRGRPPMQAEFFVKDTFGTSLGDIPIVRQVGFNPNAGPGPNVIGGGMATGGFDVVSMMFALHYSYETEQLARGMLRNVAGALKKGGKFIGVMPDSDAITANVKRLLQHKAAVDGLTVSPGTAGGTVSSGKATTTPMNGPAEDEDDWDPEKPSEPAAETVRSGVVTVQPAATGPSQVPSSSDVQDEDDDWDPEKPSEPTQVPTDPSQTLTTMNQTDHAKTPPEHSVASTSVATYDPDASPVEWGNSIYKVRFQRQQPLTRRPLPKDGIFRPPFGWKYHYSLEEAVNVPEYVVPWEAFRALAEEYGLELMYRKGFREVFEDESNDRDLGMLAERMGVMSRDRSQGRDGLLVSDEEMEAASFYHAFCFYKT